MFIVTYAKQSDTDILEAYERFEDAIRWVLDLYLEEDPEQSAYLVFEDHKCVAVVTCLKGSYSPDDMVATALVLDTRTGATGRYRVSYTLEGGRYVGTRIEPN